MAVVESNCGGCGDKILLNPEKAESRKTFCSCIGKTVDTLDKRTCDDCGFETYSWKIMERHDCSEDNSQNASTEGDNNDR